MELAQTCERYGEGFFGQPVNSVTSLAFVLAGVAILSRGDPRHRTFAGLVAAVGVGSLVQHGPHPDWQAYAHDLPLGALLAYVAVDAASDLAKRRLSPAWWLVPAAGMIPAVALGPTVSTVTQGVFATAAIGLNLLRAKARPRLRRRLLTSLTVLAAGSAAGTLGDRTALCEPESLFQGHAIWHLLAAAALWHLAPAIGDRAVRVPAPAAAPAQAD